MKRLPAALLSACALGLVLCPFVYLAAGVLSDFSPAFSTVAIPLFVAASAFLLWRFLAKPGAIARSLVPIEALSWLVVIAFLYFASGINLMRGWQRFGSVCSLFLATSGGCLPIVLLRRTTIETRLARLSRLTSIVALVLIVGGAAIATAIYVGSPPHFIGGSGSTPESY